jgi:signal transduction histidine kinase
MKNPAAKRPLNILYLEDNSNDRQLVEQTLKGDGLDCRFAYAQTKREFLAALRGDAFDLILSDFTLPAYDGATALDTAQKLQPEIPFVLLSGTIGEERVVEFLKGGAADCLLKENMSRLGSVVRRALREANEHAGRKQAEGALRALAGRLQASREEERILISREIHDELGEALTAQKFGLSWLRGRLEKSDKASIPWKEVFAKIDALGALANATADRVRKLCAELRPAILDDLGLAAAIEWQVKEFRSRTSIRCEIAHNVKAEEKIGNDQTTAAFRIFQEMLTNVARHAYASKVLVSLKKKGDRLVLQVKDNGKGIADQQANGKTSLGILGMRERAALIGGELVIRGKPGRGTTAVVTIPLKPSMPQPADPNLGHDV